jgi:hypothetical protein
MNRIKNIATFNEYLNNDINNYLTNIRSKEKNGGVWYNADFGRNGGITWEIPDSQENNESSDYLIIQSINRDKNLDDSSKEDSKGEGTKALASLFSNYPSIKEFIFDDYANFNFWEKIGAKGDSLKKEDFMKYYNKKFLY